MKVYRLVPQKINFLEKPELVKIEAYEGEEINTFAMSLQYYKTGKTYVIIDPKIGLPIFTTTQKAKIRKIAEEKMPNYLETLKANWEKIMRIHNTYFDAIKEYKRIEELKKNSNFDPLTELAKRGSGFQGGKQRILDAMTTIQKKKDQIDFIKKEYGTGGFGTPRKSEDQFELCSGWWDSTIVLLEWYVPYQEEKEVGKYTYSQLTNEIENLIENNKYI